MSYTRIVSFTAFMAFCLLVCLAFGTTSASAKDSRFMVIASHTPEDCLKTLDEANAKGKKFLGQFEWGCMVGDHTGYAMVEAKDEASVKSMLPASMQSAKIVKINKFTADQIKSFHEKK